MYRFAMITDFVRNIIGLLEVGRDKTRVAVMIFSDRTTIKFHLNRYYTIKDLQDAIIVIDFPGGKTNISGSLRVLIDSMYLPQNGGRANAQRVGNHPLHCKIHRVSKKPCIFISVRTSSIFTNFNKFLVVRWQNG